MRRAVLFLLGVASLWLIPAGSLLGQGESLSYFYRVVEPFDGPEDVQYEDELPLVWRVRGGKQTVEGYPKLTYVPETWPVGLYGTDPGEEEKDLRVIGVRTKFEQPGYNVLELVPGNEIDGQWTPRGFDLPGRVRVLDFWVWGSDRRQTSLELHILDAQGIVHRLDAITAGPDRIEAGSLSFLGWRNLFVKIPSSVRQKRANNPGYVGLKLLKFVFRTHPSEENVDLYVYLDQLRVFTETDAHYYDGYELASHKRVVEIWGEGDGEPAKKEEAALQQDQDQGGGVGQ